MERVSDPPTPAQEREDRRTTMLPPEQIRRRVRARAIRELAELLYSSDIGDGRASLEAAPVSTRERYERAAVDQLFGPARDARMDDKVVVRHGFRFPAGEVAAAERAATGVQQ